MLGVVRLGDICLCVCCCHHHPTCRNTIGIAITGANSVLSNSLPTVRLNDMFICDCGHSAFVTSASSSVSAGKLNIARLGDSVRSCAGAGTIITASENISNLK